MKERVANNAPFSAPARQSAGPYFRARRKAGFQKIAVSQVLSGCFIRNQHKPCHVIDSLLIQKSVHRQALGRDGLFFQGLFNSGGNALVIQCQIYLAVLFKGDFPLDQGFCPVQGVPFKGDNLS